MIDSKDLRIGNLVYYGEEVISVKTIGDLFTGINEWHDMGMWGSLRYENIQPIELTEEWLLRFGFEKVEFHIPDKYDNGKLRIKKDNRGFWIIACYNFILITSVSQLQNIYYFLTGQELTIK
jgi:hypothetical protein